MFTLLEFSFFSTNYGIFLKLCNPMDFEAIMWSHHCTKSEALLETSFQFIANNLKLKQIFYFSFLSFSQLVWFFTNSAISCDLRSIRRSHNITTALLRVLEGQNCKIQYNCIDGKVHKIENGYTTKSLIIRL